MPTAKTKTASKAKVRSKPDPKPKPQYFSISELSRLTALDRGTIRRRLVGIKSKAGERDGRCYLLKDALPPLISGESQEMDDAKLRKAKAEADIREHDLAVQREEMVSVKDVRDTQLDLWRRVHNRIAKNFPRTIGAQVYKATSPAHATQILARELDRIFNEIRTDHKAFR